MPRSRQVVSAPLPMVQDRSRSTVDRLIQAALTVLSREGLAATTVSAVAMEAGAANQEGLAPERWDGRSAAEIIDAVVREAVAGYRKHRKTLAALLEFAETHPEPVFRDTADELRRRSFAAMSALLLERKREIT